MARVSEVPFARLQAVLGIFSGPPFQWILSALVWVSELTHLLMMMISSEDQDFVYPGAT